MAKWGEKELSQMNELEDEEAGRKWSVRGISGSGRDGTTAATRAGWMGKLQALGSALRPTAATLAEEDRCPLHSYHLSAHPRPSFEVKVPTPSL